MAQIEGTPEVVDMTDKAVSHLSYDSKDSDTDDSQAIHAASYNADAADATIAYILQSVSFNSQQIGKNRVFYM